MKKINISTPTHPDTFALVDNIEYIELNAHKWYAHEEPNGNLYAVRVVRVDGKQTNLMMHTAIMGKIDGKEIDHRNRITLDNQRHNLRHCTHAENQRNTGMYRNNTSGYKGVCWHKGANKWRAKIKCNGKTIHLGLFFCIIKAAKCYDEGAKKYHGEFANLNFT